MTGKQEETTALILHRIQEIERRDDNQILTSLAGEAIKEYAYRFTDSKGRLITGLSWAGIKEITQLRGNMVVQDVDIQDTDDYIRVVVRATDLDRNISVFGGCHQPKKMRVKVEKGLYELVPDDFCFQKAISKAQRNAFKNLLPTTLLTKMMEAYLGKKPAAEREREPGGSVTTPPGKKINPDEIKTFTNVYKASFDLYKLQPPDVLRQLGVLREMDLTITPKEAFLTIQALYEKPEEPEKLGDANQVKEDE